jgi:uncharacterized protein (DUF305 family)
MVQTVEREQSKQATSSRAWKIATVVFAIVAAALLVWAVTLQNRLTTMQGMHGEMMKNMPQGMMGGSSPMGMDHQQLGSAGPDYDRRFIDAMIPHHQSAIEMARDALQKSQRAEVKTMAREIVDAQQKEVSQLREWRKSWYGN